MDDQILQRLHSEGYRDVFTFDPYRAKRALTSCGIETYLVADGERVVGLAPSWAAALYEAYNAVDGGFDNDLDLESLRTTVARVRADLDLQAAITAVVVLGDRSAVRRFLVQQGLM